MLLVQAAGFLGPQCRLLLPRSRLISGWKLFRWGSHVVGAGTLGDSPLTHFAGECHSSSRQCGACVSSEDSSWGRTRQLQEAARLPSLPGGYETPGQVSSSYQRLRQAKVAAAWSERLPKKKSNTDVGIVDTPLCSLLEGTTVNLFIITCFSESTRYDQQQR